MLFSFAPVMLPILGLGGLIDAIGPLIVPLIIFVFWIIGTVASRLAKQNQKRPDADAPEKLRERRRRMEAMLGLPPDSLRGANEPTSTSAPTGPPALPGRQAEPVRPVSGGRAVVPNGHEASPRPRQRRAESQPVTAAQTGEIGATEIGTGEGRADLPVVLTRPRKALHPIAALLRNPKTVRQLIAAREVLDRPQW